MPEGADTVFMQEDVRVEGGKVVVPAGLKPGANVRPAGEDIALGHPALKAGQRLRPQDIALAAAFGLTGIDVIRRIRVAVFSTGDELASPGEARGAAQLFDSNRFMLIAMLRRLGCEVSDAGIFGDERASLANGLKQMAADHDLLLTTGGVSTGEEDHVKASGRERGLAGAVADGDQARPSGGDGDHRWNAVHRIARQSRWRVSSPSSMWCGRPFSRCQARGRSRWCRCRFAPPSATRRKSRAANMSASACARPRDGALEAVKFPREGAGLLSSLADTDGLVELGEEVTQVEPGQTVGFLSYANLMQLTVRTLLGHVALHDTRPQNSILPA